MKRLLFIMFTLLIAVTLLAACGDTEVTTDGGATTTTTEGSTTTTTEGGTVTTTTEGGSISCRSARIA